MSALLGSLMGGLLTLAGVMITQRQQWRRDLAADARGLRNARLERLRAAYSTLIESATIIQFVAAYRRAKYEATEAEWLKHNENHIQRIEAALEPAIEAGRKAQVTLILDSGSKAPVELVHGEYIKARAALTELERAIQQAAGKHGHKLPETDSIISGAISNINNTARTHLAEIEKADI
jgi:hypothetical protein